MAKGRKTGGQTAGTPNKASAEMKSLLAEMLPDDRLKKEWNKWLRHSDPRIAFEAFKLANAYLFRIARNSYSIWLLQDRPSTGL